MIPRELEDLLLTNNLKNICYGDDTVLIIDSEGKLKDLLVSENQKKRLNINCKKR